MKNMLIIKPDSSYSWGTCFVLWQEWLKWDWNGISTKNQLVLIYLMCIMYHSHSFYLFHFSFHMWLFSFSIISGNIGNLVCPQKRGSCEQPSKPHYQQQEVRMVAKHWAASSRNPATTTWQGESYLGSVMVDTNVVLPKTFVRIWILCTNTIASHMKI